MISIYYTQEIPEHATYHWAVHPNASMVGVDKQELQVTFMQYGRYQISVKGGYPAGSFSKEIVLTAECEFAEHFRYLTLYPLMATIVAIWPN